MTYRVGFSWGLGLAAILLFAGCGPQSGEGNGEETGQSGAQQSGEDGTAQHDPAATVQEFLEAVRVGDDEKVVSMFSSAAQEQAGKLNRQFAPKGSDTARYSVGEVEMVPPDGARVNSTWTDLDAEGEMRTDKITWMMRKEDEGWRVAGMAAEVFPGEPPLLLDFENMEETLRKVEMLEAEIRRREMGEQGEAASGADYRTAQSPEGATGASTEPVPQTR